MIEPLRRLALALGLALLTNLVPAVVGPVAAAEELRLEADATYRVDLDDAVVRVRIDVTVTNRKPNTVRTTATGTVTTRYYWDQLIFNLQAEARQVRVTAGGDRQRISIEPKDRFRELQVRMAPLYYPNTRNLRIEYVLPGGEPRADSDVRVGSAYLTFTAWAWGDDGRGSARVVLPAGFVDAGFGTEVERSVDDDGNLVLSSGTLDSPYDWYRVVNADRRAALTDLEVDVPDGRIVVHAWPEDVEWQELVVATLRDGVPDLQDRIGLAWPVVGDLDVIQVHTPLLEGYAGFYDASLENIQVSEDLDPQLILHEAAHAWFHGGFAEDRWIVEGLADVYADRVLTELGHQLPPAEALDRTKTPAFALGAWGAPRRIDDDAQATREQYGYAAANHVMDAIVDEVGEDGMREVFAAIQAGHVAYRGDGEPDIDDDAVDWRRFLDLLEVVGGGEDVVGLFDTWVLSDPEKDRVAERGEARESYAALAASARAAEADTDGDGWAPPAHLRAAMGEWAFSDVAATTAAAEAVVDAWTDLRALEAVLGTHAPSDVEDRFEGATDDEMLAALVAELGARAVLADELKVTRERLAAERSLDVQVGLLGEAPGAGFEAAMVAYRTGDLAGTEAGVAATAGLLDGAPVAGQTRIAVAAAVVIGLLALLIVAAWLIRRRRRRAALASAVAADASTTLPGTPEPSVDPVPPAPIDPPATPMSEPGAPPD